MIFVYAFLTLTCYSIMFEKSAISIKSTVRFIRSNTQLSLSFKFVIKDSVASLYYKKIIFKRKH